LGQFDAGRALEYLQHHITPLLLTQKSVRGEGVKSLLQELPSMLFSSSTTTRDLKKARLELFEKLVAFLPVEMRPPQECISDFMN
jgi:hypothetical protein